MNQKEVNALIRLLDDPDKEIASHVQEKLFSLGQEILPILESEWEACFDALVQQRLEQIISDIQFSNIKSELYKWSLTEEQDLFDGAFLLAKYKYPDLEKQHISDLIDKIRLDVWLELNQSLNSFEKVKVLNHVFYNLYQFSANVSNYHAPQNSFINNVLESRKGNPVSLSVIYQIVANRLGIPIYGVNLPQHFVLAYKDDRLLEKIEGVHYPDGTGQKESDGILFYINAFNRGALLSLSNLEQFLRQLNLPPDERYFVPCSNLEIIKRMLRNLVFAHKQQSDRLRMYQVASLLEVLGEKLDLKDQESEPGYSDEPEDDNA